MEGPPMPVMSPELDSLYRAILDAPSDDAPRLVYADWLEEYGDDGDRLRAEFIRLQLRLDRPLGINNWSGEDITFGSLYGDDEELARVSELLESPLSPQTAAFAWSQPIFDLRFAIGRRWPDAFGFRRGFVHRVMGPLEGLLRCGPAIVDALPIERMTVTDRKPFVSREDGDALFCWVFVPERAGSSSGVPLAVFDRLYGRPYGEIRMYPSAQAAKDDLEDVILGLCQGAARAAQPAPL